MAYRLTQEGLDYLEKGLPEKQLVNLVEEKAIPLAEARSKISNFSVALQWAKRNRWVRIDGDNIILVSKPDSFPVESALRDVHEGSPVSDELLSLLSRRRLIEEIRDDIVSRASRLAGREITHLTEDLIKTGMWKKVKFRAYNISSPGRVIYGGRRHPYAAFLDWVKHRLASLGFEEMSGPLIETEFWNMDALYMPQDHSARDIHDAYFIKRPSHARSLDGNILNAVKRAHERGIPDSRGWEYKYDEKRGHRYILRTHGTVLSARTLASSPKIPGKYFSISRCFRYDVIDAMHLPDFMQVEGIILDHDINFRHLCGVLRLFAKEFANSDRIRLVPGYFPFTEPSVELHVMHEKLGWIELGGAGIFRKEMTKPLSIDVPVIAWGLGIDRIGMCNLNVHDIRDLFSHDLKFLREQVV